MDGALCWDGKDRRIAFGDGYEKCQPLLNRLLPERVPRLQSQGYYK